MKHGRADLPFRFVRGDGGAGEYQARCECGFVDAVGAPRWLPDKVVVEKFVAKGWTGRGHHSEGIPLKLVCSRCGTKELQPKPRAINGCLQKEESPQMKIPTTNYARVKAAFEAGCHTTKEATDYIKDKFGIELDPNTQVASPISKLRKAAGMPALRRRRAAVEADQEPKATSLQIVPLPAPREKATIEEGEEILRQLSEWAKRMKEEGHTIIVTQQGDGFLLTSLYERCF